MALAAKEKGNDLFGKGDFVGAVDAFSEAIELSPKDHVLYSNRSGAYASQGNYPLALKDAQKCTTINPKWPKGYSRLGLALLRLGRVQESREAYSKGLELDPENKQLRQGLDSIDQVEIEQITMGIQNVPKIKKFADEDPSYLGRLSPLIHAIRKDPMMLEIVLKNPDLKIREGLMAVLGGGAPEEETRPTPPKKKEEPRDTRTPVEKEADAFKTEGNNFYKKKQFVEALEAYDKANQVNPADITYLTNKAAVYLEMGEFGKGEALCLELLEKRSEIEIPFTKIAKVYSRLGAIYSRQAKWDEAIEVYKKSLLEDNDRLARVALREAERAREKQIKENYLDPEKAEEHRAKGNELFKKGDYPAAKKEYDEAYLRCEGDARILSNRAAVLTKLGEFPAAMQDCDKALAIDPKFVKCWLRKGNLHLSLKDNHKAMKAFEQALELDPTSSEAQEGRIKVFQKIQAQNSSTDVDQEQYAHAMADPEIQEILKDPQFQMILKKITENPNSLSQFMQDPKIAEGISKLMSAGILRAA